MYSSKQYQTAICRACRNTLSTQVKELIRLIGRLVMPFFVGVNWKIFEKEGADFSKV